MNMFKKVKELLKSGKFIFSANVVDRASSFILFFLIAHLFDPKLYGTIVTIFATVNIILILFNFGLPIFLQRESSKHEDVSTIFSNILYVKGLSYFLILSLSILYFTIFKSDIELFFVLIILAATVLLDLGSILNHFFYGKNKFNITFYSVFISRSILMLLCLGFWFFNFSIYFFVTIYLVDAIVRVGLLIYFFQQTKTQSFISKISFSSVWLILKISLPLGVTTVFNFLYSRIDIILISDILGNSSVANYNIAYSLLQLSGLIFGIFLIPSFNSFAQKTCNNFFDKDFRSTFIIILILSIFLSAAQYLFGYDIINFLFGNKYETAKNIVPVLSFALFFIGLNNFTGIFLNAIGKFKLTMISAIIGLIVNVIINIMFLEKYGVIVAVYSTIATEFVILTIQVVSIFRIRKND